MGEVLSGDEPSKMEIGSNNSNSMGLGEESMDANFIDTVGSNTRTWRRRPSSSNSDYEVASNGSNGNNQGRTGSMEISKIADQIGDYVHEHMSLDIMDEIDQIPDEPDGSFISFKTLMAYLGPVCV